MYLDSNVVSRTRIVFVDSEEFRARVVPHLERGGFEVRSADTAAAALKHLGWADCVVSEYDLPGSDGLELLETVRGRDPDLPFLLCTGTGSEAVASDAIAAGVTDYLRKGVLDNGFGRLIDSIERATAETDGETEGLLRRLHEATRRMMAETDPLRIAERTTDAAADVIDVSGAAVYYARGGSLELAAAADGGSGRPSFVDDDALEESLRDGSARTDRTDTASTAYFSLGDHGVFAVAAPEGERIGEADAQLLVVLSASAEAALDRAANERALRQERDDLAALFENIPDPAVETRMEDGQPIVERVNSAFEETFGYTDEELRGENVDEYVVPGDHENEAVAYNERVEAGKGFHGEVRRRTSDGLRDFILNVVAHNDGGTETRGYAIYTDITEQKQRERELQRQNLRIEALHGVTKKMKTATDRSDIYDIVIDAAEKILAFDICLIDEIEDDILVPKAVGSGMSLEDYYDETPIDRENNLGAETARTRETLVVDDLRDSRYAPANFGYRSALSLPLNDWGVFQAVAEEEAAFSAADRQLAELLAEHAAAAINRQERERELQERADELAKQNERLDKFASIVSHDLRNPLSVARGRLDLARMTGDEEHYRAVERAHERMDELVSGLLTLARQGELNSDPVPVELRSAAAQAWRTVETGDLELVTGDAPTVEADPERLRQLLENLFTNAAEHGDGATTVTVGRLGDGFYVADDGVGIPADERGGIFQSGRSSTEGGTGLGLVIVETVAEAHGWTVSATESEAGGARFEFRDTSDEPAA